MDNMVKSEDQCSKWFESEQSSNPIDFFGEPQKCTRIGEKYQAQIPADHLFMKESIKNEENKFIGTVEKEVQLPAVPIVDNDAFLLGLYMFGKNFNLVNKLMANKRMPDVLFHYYGQFYGDSKRKEWSSNWMNRNQRKIPGVKFFTDWRLRELFSHIFPLVTDEKKWRLTKATRLFDNKEISFETYVFSVMDIVEINLLVEAIAIGKGKKDLTRMTKNQSKNKKVYEPFPSLPPNKVIDLLKFGIELSKEKLADLFWEAVWPRLLVRGWNSQRPRNFNFNNSKNSYVYLAPGVTKFSPRGLIKGKHYFASFNDVLDKVASEPDLIDLDQDQDVLVKPVEKQCSDTKDLVRYMIVDSSLEFLENWISKIRLMESLPNSELSDQEGSSHEIQNQNTNQNGLADILDIGESRIINQDIGGTANIDQQFELVSESLSTQLPGGLVRASKYQNKRKRDVEEGAGSHILADNAVAVCKERDYVIISASENRHL